MQEPSLLCLNTLTSGATEASANYLAHLKQNSPVLTGKVQYVLHVDGGSLLRCHTMDTGTTYREIQVCTVYTENMTKKYGERTVVFDDNGESSSKDMV